MKTILHPRSESEDSQRKEFILNVLLVSSMAIFSVAITINLIIAIIRPDSTNQSSHLSVMVLVVIFTLLAALYGISRKGFFKVSAFILVTIFFSFAFLMGYRWGVDVAASLLIYMLVIVMAGILINTRFAFIVTGIVAATLLVVGELQTMNIVVADTFWRTQPWYHSDSVMTGFIFLGVATVSWLSNREIERSLARAHRSEATLRAERDTLEVIVEERTRELKETQLEKISQLYSFAEFGRLSSGLFHDLMNPLTAVSLNVERAKETEQTLGDISRVQHYLDQAFVAAKRMERFITAIRTQIGKHGEKKQFSLTEETSQVLDILSYKAHVAKVELVFRRGAEIVIVGDAVRWSQVMLNLITNGIDAYDGKNDEATSVGSVVITLKEHAHTITCTVSDNGVGIPEKDIDNIFAPFFTTKPSQPTKGTGIGLSIVKTIIEKDFNGTVAVASTASSGTTFTVTVPKH